ncbi:MAG TPA: RT0821/Lpp0805 family surface protein [Salinarimonas sp.]|nr:RT0821/Lpp0805 family surface protein [Salinarimonas sp.]
MTRRVYRMERGGVDGGRVAGAGVVLLLGLMLGGCAVSMPITSLLDRDTTGSISQKPVSPLSPDLGPEDWRRAKAALAVALDPQGNGAAVNWENPETRQKGTFAPVGAPFVKNDLVCRAFLASVAAGEEPRWLQGSACRPTGGEWTIQDVKPWRKPA